MQKDRGESVFQEPGLKPSTLSTASLHIIITTGKKKELKVKIDTRNSRVISKKLKMHNGMHSI